MARKTIVNRYYSGPPSDHFDGTLFFNPGGKPPGRFADMLRWQIRERPAPWPKRRESPFPQAKPPKRMGGENLRVTMVGHASLLIQVGSLNILTDPVWSERTSPLSFAGPRRVTAPGIAFGDLPPIDLVLVSHNHYDHLDVATLRRLKERHDPQMLTPLGNDRIIAAAVPGARIRSGDWGSHFDISGNRVHITPAHHWSARGTRDRRMALWGGFMVETEHAGRVYFAGDTGFHDGINYRSIAARHGPVRLAVLPIGAYEPRWFMEPQHQDPDEAVEGMRLLGAAFAAGCHWGTVRLTNEPIDEPAKRLAAALDGAGIARDRFRAMQAGEAWDIPLRPDS